MVRLIRLRHRRHMRPHEYVPHRHADDAASRRPDLRRDFVVHTGDVTHLSKRAQFDTAKQILGTKTGLTYGFAIPRPLVRREK